MLRNIFPHQPSPGLTFSWWGCDRRDWWLVVMWRWCNNNTLSPLLSHSTLFQLNVPVSRPLATGWCHSPARTPETRSLVTSQTISVGTVKLGGKIAENKLIGIILTDTHRHTWSHQKVTSFIFTYKERLNYIQQLNHCKACFFSNAIQTTHLMLCMSGIHS